jgi:hypothetical protein
MEKTKPKSEVDYLHNLLKKDKLKDETYEESIYSGSKGLTVKYYYKKGDKKYRIIIKGLPDDTYILKITDGENKTEKSLSKKEMKEYIKKNKKLEFAAKFVKDMKGGKIVKDKKKVVKKKVVKKKVVKKKVVKKK